MITRRSFGGMAFAGAFAAATKPFKGFAAESPCRLRLGVLSDIHVPTMEQGAHFRKALKWFDAQKVDGVVIAGDLGFAGLIKEMKCVADIWYLPPIPPSIRVFSNESTLHMRSPKY